MDLITDFIAFVTAAAASLVAPLSTPAEHRIEQTYQVAAGSLVSIDLRGGSIRVYPSEGRTARIVLIQRVRGADADEAERVREQATVELTQQGDEVRLMARGPSGVARFWQPSLQMSAEAWVPADVRLSLDTSGGSIVVDGARTAAIEAHTSGGSIRTGGATAPITVTTSGGSIRVGRVGTALRADTSGGSISVERVESGAQRVDVHTSGGSIRVGVVPAARLAIDASTSGGRVEVSGLPLTVTQRTRTRIVGRINGGAAPLTASTSGGSVRIDAVD